MNRVFKSGFVTIIGRPNVGKSTLMNQLIGQKIAITSSKAQTTRNRIQTVYTSEEGQIVFLDTPGINKAKNKLGDYMLMAAERTLNEVDLILWLVEPTTFIGGGEQYIIEKLQNVKTPIFLVINKTDIASEEEVLKAIVAYKDQCNFAEIIPTIWYTPSLIIFQKDRCTMMKIRLLTSRNDRSLQNLSEKKRFVC